MKKSFLITLIFLGSICSAFAQSDYFHLHGIIRDQETKESIPFANISILNSTRGTAANGEGEFDLMLRPSDFKESLKISSIGFISKTVSLQAARSNNPLLIELQSDIKLLHEIEISQKPINPIEIIKAALDSVSKNYRTTPFNLEFYSQMTASNPLTNQEFKVESILLGYYTGYANNTEKKFEILKKRANGDNPLKAMDYPFWPTFEIHRADLLDDPHKTGILNEKYIEKFKFKYLGVLTYDTDTLYHIEYVAPKPTEKITGYGIVPKTYKGAIFITTSNNAIVRHDIETDQFSYSIIYKKLEDSYFPYFISGERRMKGENMFSKVYNLIRLTRIELENVKVIDYKTNEFQDLSQLPDDKDYWEFNYPHDKK
jgi:hypothetical protein